MANGGGTVMVSNSTFSGNSVSGPGGGISNSGTLTVSNSTFSGNSASAHGGGIDNYGTLTVSNSTLSNNSAYFTGGAIANHATLTVSNSTLAGNSASAPFGGGGGGISNSNDSTLTVSNSTLAGNSAPSGSGIFSYSPLTLCNTIVALNTGSTGDIFGPVSSLGHNLIGNSAGTGGFNTTDLLNKDPLLGPLQDNGGPTQTMTLLPGSPATDAGDNSNGGLPVPANDQRGKPRIINGTTDIGAFEVQPAPVIWTGLSNFNWDNPANWSTNAVPGPTDDVVINTAGITVFHSASIADSVHSLQSQAAISLSSGSLSVAVDSTISGDLTLTGGTLGGTGNWTVTGLFTWKGGTVSGPAGSSLLAQGSSYLSGSDSLDTRALDLASNSTWENLNLNTNVPFTNQSGVTLTLLGRNDILGSVDVQPAFTNQAGASIFQEGNFTSFRGVVFNNDGLVQVDQAGTLLVGGVTQTAIETGQFIGQPGTLLEFFGGPKIFAATSTIVADQVLFDAFVGTPVPIAVQGSYSATGSTTIRDYGVTFSGNVSQLGNVTITGSADFSPTAGSITLTFPSLDVNGGSLSGSDNFVVSGAFDWNRGAMSGPAGSSLLAQGSSYLSGSDSLDTRALDLASNSTWENLNLNTNVPFTNQSGVTLTLLGRNDILGSDNRLAFTNQAGASIFQEGNFTSFRGMVFNNDGLVQVDQAGTLLVGGVTQTAIETGQFIGQPGTLLEFFGSPKIFTATSSIIGDQVLFDSFIGTPVPIAVQGSYSATGSTTIGGYGATFSGNVSQLGNVIISGNTDFSPTAGPITLTFPSLTLSGATLSGSDNFIVGGAFSWNGGTVTGPAGSSLLAQGSSYLSGSDSLDTRALELASNSTWENLNLNTNVPFTNQSGVTLTLLGRNDILGSDNRLAFTNQAGASIFQEGNFTSFRGMVFNNDGLVQVDQAGTLLVGGVTQTAIETGQFIGQPGTLLEFFGSPKIFTATSSIIGDQVLFDSFIGTPVPIAVQGSYSATGSTTIRDYGVTFSGNVSQLGNVIISGNTDFSPTAGPITLTFPSLTLSGATLSGSDTVYLNGGTETNPNLLDGTITLDCNLINNGYTRQASATVYLASGVTMTNAAGATLELQNHSAIVGQPGATGERFDNEGLLLAIGSSYVSGVPIGGAPDSYFSVPLTNGPAGTIHVEAGRLGIAGGGTSSGAFLGDPGTSLGIAVGFAFAAQAQAPNSAITAANVIFGNDAGPGGYSQVIACPYTVTGTTEIYNVGPNPLTLQFTGPVNIAGSNLYTPVGAAVFDFTTAQLMQPLTIANVVGGVSIFSNADLHITENAQFGGTLGGSGTFYLDGGTAANPSTFDGQLNRALVNNGYWITNHLSVAAGVIMTNTTTGTLNIQIDGTIGGDNCPVFINQGLLLKSGGQGTTYLEMDLYNSGIVEIQQGTLDVSCGYVQTAGSTVAAGGNLTGQMEIQGGDIQGSVSASVSNTGQQTVAPSSTPVTLPSYTQTSTGNLNEEIGGLTAGTQYGQIIATGDVNLAGNLHVILVNGFTPHLGDRFTIIDNQGSNPINGTFNGLPEGATVWAGMYGFAISYVGGVGNNDVVLTTTAVNRPPVASAGGPYTIREGDALTLDASQSSDLDGDTLSYSWDINGAGTFTAASGVQPTFTWAQLQALGISDEGSFTVQVRVDDGHGNVVTSPATTLTVQPVVYWVNPAGGDWDNPVNWSSGQVPDADDDVVIDTPGITVTHSASIADSVHSLQSHAAISIFGGSLSLGAASIINNTLTVSGGTLGGSGDVHVAQLAGSGTLSGSGTVYLDDGTTNSPSTFDGQVNRDLVNNGYWRTDLLFVAAGVKVTNSSTGTIDAHNARFFGADNSKFINQGTLVSGNFYNEFNIFLDNQASGTVHVTQGQFRLNGDFSNAGNFLGDSGTLIVFRGDGTSIASSSITGDVVGFEDTAIVAGTYHTSSRTAGENVVFTGDVDIANNDLVVEGGTMDFRNATLLTPLNLHNVSLNGTLLSASDIHVQGQLSGNGTLGGSGTVYLDGGTADTPSTFGGQVDRDLVNNGYWGTAGFSVTAGVLVTNTTTGTIDAYNARFFGADNSKLINQGTLLSGNFEGNFGFNGFNIFLDNQASGSVHDTHGQLRLDGGFSNAGSFLGDPGTLIDFRGGTSGASSSITGDVVAFENSNIVAGTYHASSRTVGDNVVFTGDVDIANNDLVVEGGTMDFRNATLLTPLNLHNVSLNGTLLSASDIHVQGQLSGNGTLGGSGTVYLDGGTADTPSTFGGQVNRDLVNNGYWNTAYLSVAAGVIVTNTATGTFDIHIDGTIGGNNCPVFINQGLLLKSGGSGTTHLEMDLYNSGTVEIQQGTLDVSCGYVQTAGSTVAAGGNLTGQVEIQGGDIQGSVSASVSNTGQQTVAPSSTPVTLPSYTQASTGNLNEEIGGLTAGTQYGQITVTGDVNLAGDLHVTLINGFTPHLGDQFTIIDNQGSNSINGTFNGLPEGATVWAGMYGFTISYRGGDSNDVVLTTIAVANQPPVASAGGPYTIHGGDTLTLDASQSSDPDGDALSYSWDINGAGTFTAATGVQPTFTWAQLQALGVSDEGSFTVQVRVDDGHGDVVTSPATTVTVAPNYAENLDVSGNLTIIQENPGNDNLVLSLSGGIYTLTDTSGQIFDMPTGANAASISGGGTNTITIPAAAVTAISVSLGSGTNIFTFAGSDAAIAPITVNTGSASSDQINITGAVTESGAISLTTSGSINETGSGAILGDTGTLTTSSAGGTTLNNANAVSSFNAANTSSGNVQLTNTAATLTLTGITETGGDISICNEGTITTSTDPISTTNGNGSITLTADNGGVTIGAPVTANGSGDVSLTTTGSSSDILINANVSSDSGTISVSAGGNAILNSGNLITTGNVHLNAGGSVRETPSSSYTLSTLAAFGQPDPNGLVEDSQGNFFGTTQFGGAYGYGMVYEMFAGSSSITTLASFNNSNGANPSGGTLVLDSSGNLFGTTNQGGAYGDGTVFELAAGSSTITALASFNGGNGANLNSSLVEDSSGNLFGTTTWGGASGEGTVFEVAAGSNAITLLASFNGNNGINPLGGLVEDSGGNLFGTTAYGGQYGAGTVFEVAAGSNTLTTLASFNGSNGFLPIGSLVEDSGGNLFGTTQDGGASGVGTVFELIAGSNTITPLASFNFFNGRFPYAGLIEDSSGNLFGTTIEGGAYGAGTVFEVTPGSNSITTLVSFNLGEYPGAGVIEDSSGNLFGITTGGGGNGAGMVFELAPGSNTITSLASFNGTSGGDPTGLVEDSHGNRFGITAGGGLYGYGTVFEVAAGSSIITPLASFNYSNGAYPIGSLSLDSSGNLFGTTNQGGPFNWGTVFEIVAGSNSITPLASISYSNGTSPNGVVEDSHGNLFGTLQFGGYGYGTLFEVAAGSNSITPLVFFNSFNGSYPNGGLIEDSNGNLFGTTQLGGLYGSGTIFEVAANSNTIITLASFNSSNGSYPNGSLVEDSSGNLFGTTQQGGQYNEGTVFELAAGSNTITTLASFNGGNGATPHAGLVEDSSGNLFGTTQSGGQFGYGTASEVAANSNTITTLTSFNISSGAPPSSLLVDSSGKLFGTTQYGGPLSSGTIFELSPGGTISAAQLTTSSATGIILNNPNSVASFSAANSSSGDVQLTNTAPTLALTGITETGGGISITNQGAITTSTSPITASGSISLTADNGTATIAAPVTASDNGSVALTTTGSNSDIQLYANVSSSSGTITISAGGNAILNSGSVTTTGNVHLSADGSVLELAQPGGGGIISAAQLTTSSATGTTLNNANTTASFSASNSSSGNVQLANTTATLTITGISETGGNISVTNQGAITSSTSPITTTSTNGSINLAALNGSETIDAAVTANGSGSVSLTATGSSSDILLNANLSSALGTISVSASGNAILNSGSVTTAGNVHLSAGGTVFELPLPNGGGIISAAQLTTSSATGTTLNNANTVAGFSASNSSSGDMQLTNTATTLTLTGISETGGSISVTNQGALSTSTSPITTNSNGDISLTAGSGTETIAAPVTASGSGNVTLTTTGSSSDILLNANVSSTSGTINVSAGGNAILNSGSLITTGNVHLSAGGSVREIAPGSSYTLTTLADFGQPDPTGLVEDSGGNLFGITHLGGAYGLGMVYEVLAGSSTILPLASFNGSNGSYPAGGTLVLDSHGNLFGTTSEGGANNDGTVFELAAGSNIITTVASFNGSNGYDPTAGLVADSLGNLYGTTSYGGPFGAAGTIFEVPAGSNSIDTIGSFTNNNGAVPSGGTLVRDSRGDLFGVTLYNGPSGWGTVFELPGGSGTPITLAYFNYPNIPDPGTGLVEDSNGNLYGTTADMVFEVAAGSGTITPVAFFTGSNGAHPNGATLILDSSGNLYGTTQTGGTSNDGTVFEVAAGSNSITTLASFNSSIGQTPAACLVLDSSGNLFGVTQQGGGNGAGTVFELAAGSSTIAPLASFAGTGSSSPGSGLVEDSHGNLFGTTEMGGQDGNGTVFEVPAGSNSITTLASFNGSNGSYPIGSLVLDSSGNLFGTTEAGGPYGQGALFELAAGSNSITTLASFNSSTGIYPSGGLVVDSQGNLYGTTHNGGQYGQGTVFEVPAGSSTIIPLASFNSFTGAYPSAGLAVDNQGNLYGTTIFGGQYGQGTVFEVPAGSGSIIPLASFNDSTGVYAYIGNLIQDSSGNLFGTTNQGGAFGYGTIFEVAAGSDTITPLASFNYSNGAAPATGLIEDSSGNLFGTTQAGGANGDGTLFEIAAGSNTITTLASFSGSTGADPQGGDLLLDSHGNLFSTTSFGGTLGGGTVFELVSSGGGAISAAQLTISSATGITLNNANTIGGFSASNSSSGDVQLTNTAATLTVTGITNTGGDISITNQGAIAATNTISTTSGNVALTAAGSIGTSANPVSVAATSLTTDSSAGNGNQFLDAVTPVTSSSLNAGTGNIGLAAGTFKLSGPTSFSINATTIDVQGNATLDVTGLSSGTLVLAAGQTLQGTGTVLGNITASSGSQLAPGEGPGTLATGSISLSSGSSFAVAIGGGSPGSYSQDDVNGSVSLGDATHNLSLFGGYVPQAGDKYVIIRTAGTGAINGTFAGLPEGSIIQADVYQFRISYVGGDGNDVVLTTIAPTASAGGPYTIREGDALTLDASQSSDPDGDTLSYSWDINGAGTFTAATGLQPTLSWTQLQALGVSDEGSFTVQVRMDDGHGNVVTSPATTLSVADAVPSVSANSAVVSEPENAVATNSGSFADFDDVVTISASTGTVTQTAGTSGTWSWSGPGDETSPYTVTITATNADGSTSSTSFNVSFADVAPAVTVTSSPTSVAENTTASASGIFADSDDSITSLTASEGTVSPAAPGTSKGSWSWSESGPLTDGQHTVTITSTNADGSTGSSSFTFTVTDAPPSVLANNASVSAFSNGTASNSGSFADYDDAVAVTASQGTLIQNGTTSGTWTWSQAGLTPGTYSITVTATNADNSVSKTSFTAVVSEPPSLVVTTTADESSPFDGQTSLREAIAYANSLNGHHDITFAAGLHGVIHLTTALPDLSGDVSILGPGAASLTVQRDASAPGFSVFVVDAGATTVLSGLTITGGSASLGGGILNSGTLTVSNGTLSGNSATRGGAIYNSGDTLARGTLMVSGSIISSNNASFGGGIYSQNAVQLTITNSTIANNSAVFTGGGLVDASGTPGRLLYMTVSNTTFSGNSVSGSRTPEGGAMVTQLSTATLSNCTFSGNSASYAGGGIWNVGGTLTVSNSTFTGNKALNAGAGAIYNINNTGSIPFPGTFTGTNLTIAGNSTTGFFGGGIINGGTMMLSNATVSDNSAPQGGGIVGTLTLLNTIVAGNHAPTNADVQGNLAAGSTFNLIGDGTGMTGISNGVNGNQVGTSHNPINPLLGPLQNNGGPTQTMALLAGSPAIAAGGAITTLSQNAGTADQTLYVNNAAAIASTAGQYFILIDGEEMEVTNVNSAANSLTVTRGINGITATPQVNDPVYLFFDQRGFSRPPSNPDIGAFQGITLRVASAPASVAETASVSASGTFADFDNITSLTASEGTISPSAPGTKTGSWSWSELGPLADGTQTVTITAINAKGATGSISFTFTVSDAAPTVTVTNAPASVPENSTANASGTFTDYDDSIISLTASEGTIIPSTPRTQSGSWSWSEPAPLADGPHTVTITATNADGSTGSKSFTFTVTDVAPTVTVTNAPASVAENMTASASGTFADYNDNIISLTASEGTISPSTPGSASGSWNWSELAPLADGPHTITITATNSDGSTASKSFTFTVTDVAPTVTVTNAPASVAENMMASASGTFADYDDGIISLTASEGTVSPSTPGSASGSWNWSELAPLADGTHTITITATNADGSTASKSFTFAVTDVAPTVTVANAPASVAENITASASGAFADYDDGIISWTASEGTISPSIPGAQNGSWSWSEPAPLADGPHTVTITATNADGSTASKSFTFAVTDVAPGVAANNASVSTLENALATNTGTFADYDDAVTISASSGTITQTSGKSGSWNWSGSGDEDHPYTVTITARNADGSSSTTSFAVSFTDVAPMVSPDNKTVSAVYGSTATNSGTFSDYDDAVTITASQGTLTRSGTASGTWSWSQAGVQVGTSTVTITATNADGSTATTSFALTGTKDSTTTTVTASPGTASFGQAVTFTAQVTANAPGSGTLTGNVDFYDLSTSTDLGRATLSNGQASVSPSTLAVGTHVIQASYNGDANFLNSSSTSNASVSILGAGYILNPAANQSLSLSGSSTITIPGLVIVDSSSSSALSGSGSASLVAGNIQVVGNYTWSSSGSLSPAPVIHAAAAADPLASLPVPAGGASLGQVSLSSGTLTIGPGVYSKISLSQSAQLLLQPGVYVIAGGGISVSGSASIAMAGGYDPVTGHGVLIYNGPSAGGSFGGITLSGTGSINLTTPDQGTYAGITIFQARDNTLALSLSGGAAGLLQGGAIYARSALLKISGPSQLRDALVVDRLQISGSATGTSSAEGGTTAELGFAGELSSSDLYLYVSNADGSFSASALARLDDALAGLNALLAPYSRSITEVSAATSATVIVDTAPTTILGGAADGVLGLYVSQTTTGLAAEITLVQGWNWYTGADPRAIGAGQYDFQTIVTHELGHALGLGHNPDPNSVMYASLASGTARRSMTPADLNLGDGEGRPDALHAAFPGSRSPRAALEEGLGAGLPAPAGILDNQTLAAQVSNLVWRAQADGLFRPWTLDNFPLAARDLGPLGGDRPGSRAGLEEGWRPLRPAPIPELAPLGPPATGAGEEEDARRTTQPGTIDTPQPRREESEAVGEPRPGETPCGSAPGSPEQDAAVPSLAEPWSPPEETAEASRQLALDEVLAGGPTLLILLAASGNFPETQPAAWQPLKRRRL